MRPVRLGSLPIAQQGRRQGPKGGGTVRIILRACVQCYTKSVRPGVRFRELGLPREGRFYSDG